MNENATYSDHGAKPSSGSGPNVLPQRLAQHATVPATFFTYQVLNLDPETQLLLTEVHGPAGVQLRTAYLRTRNGSRSHTRTRAIRLTIDSHEERARSTPDGRTMRLPRHYRWSVRDRDTGIALDCHAAGDWSYGLGAGFVGSFDYTGVVNGHSVAGTGYVEYVDLRSR